MGLFKKDPLEALFKDYEYGNNDDILETAKAISEDDAEVVSQMDFALKEPVKYIRENADRFEERGIEINDKKLMDSFDSDDLLFLAMLDALEEQGYAFEFDYKCELKDFLWGLEQIKGYALIKDAVQTLKLDEDSDIESWGEEINRVLGEKAALCYIDIDGDSYPLTILTYEKLGALPLPWIMAM